MSDDLFQSGLDWLNSNSGAVNSILVSLLVVVTCVYAYQTYHLVLESKAFREMSLRPALVVTAEIDDTRINLVNFRLENIGGGAAHRIRLQTNRKLKVKGKDPLNKLGLFKHGLPSLGPGRKIESFLASAFDLDFQQKPLEVTVTYSDATSRNFEEKFELNFASFENLTRVGDAPLQTVADSIKKLQENIGTLSRGIGRLSVLAYSLDDLDAERSAQNLFRKLRRVSPDGRREIETMIDEEISRLVTKE